MNIDTGHLMRVREGERPPIGYMPVPDGLRAAAERKLGASDEAIVSKTSGGKLSKWAASERKKKRKSAKEARRQNRR